MASASQTTTMVEFVDQEVKKSMVELVDQEVTKSAKKALNESSTFFQGVEWFINWMRDKVASFFSCTIGRLPVVGKWAARIGTTVSEFIFTVIGTLIGLLKTVFSSGTVWSTAHNAAMRAWTENEGNGLLAQIYAYGKKMASYFLEIIKQCLERAIKVHGLPVTSEEKDEIANMLDDVLR